MERKARYEGFSEMGYTCLTKEQYESTLETAEQSGTIVSFDDLNEEHIGKACAVATKGGGFGIFGSPCPPGFVSIYIDSTYICMLHTGELFEIRVDYIKVRSSSGNKRAQIFKTEIQAIIIIDEQNGADSDV